MFWYLRNVLMFFALVTVPLFAYSTKYENIEIDQILHNQRLYKKYFDCLTNNGKCTPDGQQLKEALPEALVTDCVRCSDKQKMSVEKVLKFMIENKPDDYSILEKIYDPNGSYRKKHVAESEKHGVIH